LSFPKFFIGNPSFYFFFGFSILWTPDRSIQGQAKNGLKIAGVTDLRKRKRVEEEGKAQEREHSLLLFRPLVEPLRNEGLGDDRTIQG